MMGVGGAAVGAGPIAAGNSRTMSHLMCIVPGVLGAPGHRAVAERADTVVVAGSRLARHRERTATSLLGPTPLLLHRVFKLKCKDQRL